MARFLIVLFTLACFLLCVIDAKKKHEWNHKKNHHKNEVSDYHDKMRNHKEDHAKNKIYYETKLDDTSFETLKRKWKKKKHGGKKHHKKPKFYKAANLKKHMPWLNILSDDDCPLECNPHEVCIKGPLDAEPLCVHLKDLKKSAKLFRKYQRKEKKAWKKFQKKHYSHEKAKEYSYMNDANEYHVTDEELNAKEYEGLDLYGKMKRAQLKKEFGVDLAAYDDKKTPVVELEPKEAGDPAVCSTTEFSQMRTRIMGWFHLLHNEAKKAEGTDDWIKAHKHSVKKELEFTGDKQCQCMESAMWEFEQMDEDEDDNLTEQERVMLEDNGMEPCMKPYLTSCDGDGDGLISREEWCCCFANVLAPCTKHMNDIKEADKPVTYMPRCDKEGYYMLEQCEGVSDDKFMCWCVDFNGNVFDGSKTNGRAACSKYAPFGSEN